MSRRATRIVKGFNHNWLLSCCLMAGYDGQWLDIRKVGNMTKDQVTRRRKNPDLFDRGQMRRIAKELNMDAYDIIKIWFSEWAGDYDDLEFLIFMRKRELDAMQAAMRENGKEIVLDETVYDSLTVAAEDRDRENEKQDK